MGRKSYPPADRSPTPRLHLRRIVLVEQNGAHHSRLWLGCRSYERGERVGWSDGVIVQQPDEGRTTFQGQEHAQVTSVGEAAVFRGLQQLNAWKRCAYPLHRVVR